MKSNAKKRGHNPANDFLKEEDLTPAEKEYFRKLDERDLEDKKKFFGSDLDRRASEIFCMESILCPPQHVQWGKLESETGWQCVQQHLKARPEDFELFKQCRPPNDAGLQLVAMHVNSEKETKKEDLKAPKDTKHVSFAPTATAAPAPVITQETKEVLKQQSIFNIASQAPLPVSPVPVPQPNTQPQPQPQPQEPLLSFPPFPFPFPVSEQLQQPLALPSPASTLEIKPVISTTSFQQQQQQPPPLPPPPPQQPSSSLTKEDIQKIMSETLATAVPTLQASIVDKLESRLTFELKPLVERLNQTDSTLQTLLHKQTPLPSHSPQQGRYPDVDIGFQRDQEFQDAYRDDLLRQYKILLGKFRAEGFVPPEGFNLEIANLCQKETMKERIWEDKDRMQFIGDKEGLAVTATRGIELLLKGFGVGGNMFNGLGSAMKEFVDQEKGLRQTLEYIYRKRKSENPSRPVASLSDSLLRILMNTLTANFTPHLANTVAQGVKDLKTLVQPARNPEEQRKKRVVKRKGKKTLRKLRQDVYSRPQDEEDDQSGEEVRDSDPDIERSIDAMYMRTNKELTPDRRSILLNDPDQFILETKKEMRKHATTEKARTLLQPSHDIKGIDEDFDTEIADEKGARRVSFRRLEPGETPKLQAVQPMNVLTTATEKLFGADGAVQGILKGYQDVQSCHRNRQEEMVNREQLIQDNYGDLDLDKNQ